ncbi:unnamed protein product [marine sediment metagenome]|uniref:Uncharacterized protein n=1 Tax=marine sediment metagenome TaxID=412755 RepID=X1B022_9ZZZZ
MIEEENNFLEFLNYQITQKNKFEHVVRKIPLFKSMIHERHQTILKMIDKFEDVRRREVYDMLVQEFNKAAKRI